MKKTFLILILIIFCNHIFAQKTWFINNPKGFDFYLTTTIEDDIITGMTRENALIDIVGRFKYTLAKMTTSIAYPEIVHFEGKVRGDSFTGKYQMLFDQLNFNGMIKNDSIKIVAHKNNKTTELNGVKVDKVVPIRNYKETVHELIQLAESDVANKNYIKSSKWSDFKKEIIEISDRINDDFELEVAFGGIGKNLPEDLIEKIKEYTRVLLNIE